MPEVSQTFLIVFDRGQLLVDTLVEFGRVVGSEIAQLAVLEPTPNRFGRVEHRSIRRQLLQTQAGSELFDLGANRIPFVHRSTVPDDYHSVWNLAHQPLQKARRMMVIEIVVDQRLENQPQAVSIRRQPQGPGQRDFLPVFAFLLQNGRLAPPGPSASNQGSHQKPTFIDQTQVRTLPARFFLMRGQSSRSQRAIFSGSRSRGTRVGFCRDNPWARNHRASEWGFNAMPHSSAINCTRRSQVHSSVANPNSVGFSLSQRSTIFSWVRDSFRGRPGMARAANPTEPCRRNSANHRLTLRASTFRKSATSSVVYPSIGRSTAKCRRRSRSAG